MPVMRRFAVTLVGAALLLVGGAMTVLPGPGILLVLAGLAVLATEYVWARSLLARARHHAERVQEAAVASPLRTAGSLAFGVGLVGAGLSMVIIADVAWPVFADLLDAVWGPVTGSVLIVTGVVVGTTTVLTMRAARGEQTTYTPDPGAQPGTARSQAPPAAADGTGSTAEPSRRAPNR